MPDPASKNSAAHDAATYTVVARRYRPKSFAELVGQEHIAQALGKAIATGRVGHAYLFTGARGVGKTSSARIFAKALNAPGGPSIDAVPESDMSQAIDTGEDVDVIEIDAASNRGIDEIRQLRANVSVRPSRSRYKIYIIDEVHMLTNQAFNALLKTLEEPPEHVKFIFCTTDPEKVPITVLSRCQRFDFAPVRPDAIKGRLAEICEAEGFQADDEALALLARRAAGSMRDSQSLLEQVMSFSSGKITIEQVHALLGTADETRLRELADALASRNGVAALQLVDKAINEGTDAGQFAEQMLGYLRDLMAVAVGGGPELLKVCNPSGFAALKELADGWGLQTILSAVQLLDESLVRMRFSVQSQALFEVALIQISQLQDLATIAKIIESVQQGTSLPIEKKNNIVSRSALAPVGVANQTLASGSGEELGGTHIVDRSALPVSVVNQTLASGKREDPGGTPRLRDAVAPVGVDSQTLANGSGEDPGGTPRLRGDAPGGTPRLRDDVPGGTPRLRGEETGGAPGLGLSGVMNLVAAAAASSGNGAVAAGPTSDGQPVESALTQWREAAAKIDGMLGDFAGRAVAVEATSDAKWTIVFAPGSNKSVDYCEAPARKDELQQALTSVVGHTVQFAFRVQPGQMVKSTTEVPVSSTVARSQRLRQLSEHPFVSKVCELLQGEIVRVDPPAAVSTPHVEPSRQHAGT